MGAFLKLVLAPLIVAIFAGCSIVPSDPAKLTGLRTLAEWRAEVAAATKKASSKDAYKMAAAKVNSLIDPTLKQQVDNAARNAIFGLALRWT